MARFDTISLQLEAEILKGRHGTVGQRFLTVRQIAQRYGIALVTAHKVLKRLKDEGLLVSDSTNPAVISPAAARRMGAIGGGPRRIGIVVTNIASPFFSNLCRYVQHAAGNLGCQVLMASSQYDVVREQKAIESFLEIGVEGLLIVPGVEESCRLLYGDLLARRVPLVFVSRHVEELPADFVVADSFAASAAVAGHLLSMGYDRLAYLGFSANLKRDVRLSGFRAALLEEGIDLTGERIAFGEGGTIGHGRKAMARLMDRRSRPRAVFAFSDLLAIGALQYCQEHEIAVPDEVAIAGFDNLPQSHVTSPPLTTVAYPVESMARLAVQCLLDRIRQTHASPSRILLEPRLVVRRSTDPATVVEPDQLPMTESYEMPYSQFGIRNTEFGAPGS